MSRWQKLFGRRKQQPAKSRLGIESLESRDLMSASPLPVLLVVADQRDFYYREYGDTRASIESKGLDVVVAAATTNPTTPHWNTGQPAGTLGTITPDIALTDVNAADYSAIAFVGGWGASMYQYAYNDPNGDGVTDNYYVDGHYNGDPDLNDGVIASQKIAANTLINEFLDADKPVAAICHGVTVLAWARVDGASPLAGKQVAVPHLEGTPDQFYDGDWRNAGYFHGQRDQVIANGGLATAYSGAYGKAGPADDVIVDGRVITGENPASAALFGVRIAEEVLANRPPGAAAVGNNLVVTGTPNADTVYLWSGATANQVTAWVNGTQHGPYRLPDGGRVIVRAGDGNDQVFATDLRIDSEIHGEGGHDLITGGMARNVLDGGDGVDRLWGGPAVDLIRGGNGDDYVYGNEGNDILLGGAGNDRIEGFDGRDLLIGGLGTDVLKGGAGDDVLIGGTTTYDDSDAALGSLQAIWLSPGDLDMRLGQLSQPAGVGLRFGDTIADDGESDALVGGADGDWVLQNVGDIVYLMDADDRVATP